MENLVNKSNYLFWVLSLAVTMLSVFFIAYPAQSLESEKPHIVAICADNAVRIADDLQQIADNNEAAFDGQKLRFQGISTFVSDNDDTNLTYVFIGDVDLVEACLMDEPFYSALMKTFHEMKEQWEINRDYLPLIQNSAWWIDNATVEREGVVDGIQVQIVIGGTKIDFPHVIFRSLGLSSAYCDAIQADYCNKEGME